MKPKIAQFFTFWTFGIDRLGKSFGAQIILVLDVTVKSPVGDWRNGNPALEQVLLLVRQDPEGRVASV